MTTSRLGGVKKTRIIGGQRFAFYGPESVGKSSLAAAAPNPIFLDVEDGTGNLDVARYPFNDGPSGHVPKSYEQVLSALRDIYESKHDYKTVVIDTLDRLEGLLWDYQLARDSGKQSMLNRGGGKLTSVESYGWGKGYVLAVDLWRELCGKLNRLRLDRGMNIVLLGHAAIRTFRNPEGEDYDRYHLRIHEKAAGFIKEWCDLVGFVTFEEGGAKLDPGQNRAKGYSTGRRLIKLTRTAAYDAKSRIPLPDEVELDSANPWGPLAEAMKAGMDIDPAHVRSSIKAELERIGDSELTGKVGQAVLAAGDDTATLCRYLSNLKNREQQEMTNV